MDIKDSDTLPKRIFQAAKEGFRAGKAPNLDTMLVDYYRLRGWNENGYRKNR